MRNPLLILCLLLAHTGLSQANDSVESRRKGLMKTCLPAFAFVGTGKGQGSGVVISADGLVLTNHHVVDKAKTIQVLLGNGKSFKANILGRHKHADLALLKLEQAKDLPHLKLGDSDALEPGDPCVAIGNPVALGLVDRTPSVSFGVISALHQFRSGGTYNDAIVTDAPINPGNSGGPLLNMAGEVIGINGMVEPRIGLRSNTGLGYAIPANQIKLWLPHLKDPKTVDVYPGRFFGVRFESDPKLIPGRGALIKEVAPDSDAARIGLEAGDLVLKCQGLPVWNVNRLIGILLTYPPGTAMRATVKRADETKVLEFILEPRRPAQLGFSLARPRPKDKTVRIAKVDPEGAAAKAGLQNGDRLIGLGEHGHLPGPVSFQYKILTERWMESLIAGAEIKLRIERDVDGKTATKLIEFKAD